MSGAPGRTESARLLGTAEKLFSVNTPDGYVGIEIRPLPASMCIDWTVYYENAVDLHTDLMADAQLYEAKGPHDWGVRIRCAACDALPDKAAVDCTKCGGSRVVPKDRYQTKEEYRSAFPERKKAVFAAFTEAFWKYGEMCTVHFGGEDPLKRAKTEAHLTPAQIMDAVTRMQRIADPLKCWETSLLQRAVDQKDTLSGPGTPSRTGSER